MDTGLDDHRTHILHRQRRRAFMPRIRMANITFTDTHIRISHDWKSTMKTSYRACCLPQFVVACVECIEQIQTNQQHFTLRITCTPPSTMNTAVFAFLMSRQYLANDLGGSGQRFRGLVRQERRKQALQFRHQRVANTNEHAHRFFIHW